jgi:hypothetical protein
VLVKPEDWPGFAARDKKKIVHWIPFVVSTRDEIQGKKVLINQDMKKLREGKIIDRWPHCERNVPREWPKQEAKRNRSAVTCLQCIALRNVDLRKI